MLQGEDRDAMPLHCGNSFGRSLGGGERSDGGNARQHRGAADRLLVEERVLAARRIHDELNAFTLDEVHCIGPALIDFEHPLDDEARAFKHIGGAFSCDDFEAEIDVAARQRNASLLVVIVHE